MAGKHTSLPDTLYKFRPFSLRAIEDMAANRIFLSSPRAFNDAYDCNIPWGEFLSADELAKIAGNDGPFADSLRELKRRRADLFDDGWQLTEEGHLHLRGLLVDHFAGINDCGIYSLSAVRSDLKMWAHYADSRRGFCLGFSTAYAPFSEAMSVGYTSAIKELDAYRLFAGRISGEEAFEFLITKADIWAEEREYRIFSQTPDTYLKYAPRAVRSITFGDRTPIEHMVISHSTLPEHVEFAVVSPKENSYEFEPVRIDRDVLERYR